MPGRKWAKNNDGHKRPLLELQIEESFQTFFLKKCDFSSKKLNKTENPKITSKVLNDLLIRSYEQFKWFS